MFIPIGDNVEKRTLPFVPVILIVTNVIVFCYQMRVFMTPRTGLDDVMTVSYTHLTLPTTPYV